MDRKFRENPGCGFTLIELMLVSAILAVTALVAIPSMQRMIHANKIASEASRLMTAINLTRSEAVARNTLVSMCPSAMSTTGDAVCSGVYSDGWIIFSNPDKDRVVDAGTDEVIRIFAAMPQGYSLSNKVGDRAASELLSYLPDGSSRRNRTLLICPPTGVTAPSVSIVLNLVGRPRRTQGWGTCPGVAKNE